MFRQEKKKETQLAEQTMVLISISSNLTPDEMEHKKQPLVYL